MLLFPMCLVTLTLQCRHKTLLNIGVRTHMRQPPPSTSVLQRCNCRTPTACFVSIFCSTHLQRASLRFWYVWVHIAHMHACKPLCIIYAWGPMHGRLLQVPTTNADKPDCKGLAGLWNVKTTTEASLEDWAVPEDSLEEFRRGHTNPRHSEQTMNFHAIGRVLRSPKEWEVQETWSE